MNREEIVQAVQSYIRNENEKYALLINGAWGEASLLKLTFAKS